MLRFLLPFMIAAAFRRGAALPGPKTLSRVRRLRERPLPPELAVAPPRPDVWGERGYLSQPRYQRQYKPLLTHGFATWGFVYQYSSSGGGEDYDFTASYAWLDSEGQLQVRHLQGGYDAIHAAYGRGLGDIVVDTDAELGEDVELIILHDLKTGAHLPYRALRAEPGREKPPPSSTQRAAAPPPPPGEGTLDPAGTFRLEWETSQKSRSVRLVRPQGRKRETLFTVERKGSSNREWTLTRPRQRGPALRALHQPAPGFEASFHLSDSHGQPIGTVTEKAGRVRLVLFTSGRQQNFYTGSGDSKDKRTLLEEMQDVLTLERTKSKDRDTLVLHRPTHRSVLELLVLGLAAVRHPPRPRRKS